MDGSLINTSIGPFIVKKVLDFFDEPLLFSCIDPAGRIYLAIIVDEIDSINRWFFLPISEARLQKIESGIIPLRDLFISPELSWLFDITGRLFCQETADVKFLKISSVPESYYPDEDSYISINYDSNIEEPFLLED